MCWPTARSPERAEGLSPSLSLSVSVSLHPSLSLPSLSLPPAPTKSWKARPGSGLLQVGNQDPATLHHDLELVRIQAACSFNRHCLSTCCVSGPGLALGAQTGCPRWWKPEEGTEKKQSCVGCPLGSGTVVMPSTFGLIPTQACEVFTYLNRFHQLYQLKVQTRPIFNIQIILSPAPPRPAGRPSYICLSVSLHLCFCCHLSLHSSNPTSGNILKRSESRISKLFAPLCS